MNDSLIAVAIVAISFVALLQFFVSYCHSLIAKSRGHEFSAPARELSGITGSMVGGDQFKRLQQLIALCPESRGDKHKVRALSTYFSMLGSLQSLSGRIFPAAAKWIDLEIGGCAYLAAVMLDRRIAYNRGLMARQAVPYSN